jgi:high-affinity nickel-transport protein
MKFLRAFDDGSTHLRGKIVALYVMLIAFNLAAWAWAFLAFRDYPVLLGTAFLAYSFGLRHAVDADHIAAIDNVTRKLIQEGKRPVTVGLFFSLGHSTVVILASIAVVATATAFQNELEGFRTIGGIIGTSVSAAFLLLIATANIFVFVSTYRTFRRVRNGEAYVTEDLDLALAGGGLLARMFRKLFRLISQSWHMYPLGFLFGLGFDTATEIGLLGISAAGASQGLPIWSILVFPALFTAGMTLIDTTDNILMLGAYGWAMVKPIRKLYYNMTITLVSIVVAVVIGGVEALGLIAAKFDLTGGIWDVVSGVNDNLGFAGYVVIGVFIACWIGSMAFYRFKQYDLIEPRRAEAPAA